MRFPGETYALLPVVQSGSLGSPARRSDPGWGEPSGVA
jgi:hypothetical protein